MIELRNVGKTFQGKHSEIKALAHINLTIPEKSIYGIIGSSGAGKSTLIRCVNMLERPTMGEVIVDGVNLTKLSAGELGRARRQIGMIFQHFNLLSSRTVFDNVALPLELIKMPKKAIEERVEELLELVGLGNKSNEYPARLSGGQKQRVAIARALASAPKILLCDEATSALDPATTRAILQLLKDINRRLHITIVLITHEMDIVKDICDQVAVLSEGEIVEQGAVHSIFSHAKTSLTQQFIDSSLHVEIAHEYLERLAEQPSENNKDLLVRLRFGSLSIGDPLLSSVVKLCNIDYEVVKAKIDTLGTAQVGVMLLKLTGVLDDITKAIDYFNDRNVKVEVIGYV